MHIPAAAKPLPWRVCGCRNVHLLNAQIPENNFPVFKTNGWKRPARCKLFAQPAK